MPDYVALRVVCDVCISAIDRKIYPQNWCVSCAGDDVMYKKSTNQLFCEDCGAVTVMTPTVAPTLSFLHQCSFSLADWPVIVTGRLGRSSGWRKWWMRPRGSCPTWPRKRSSRPRRSHSQSRWAKPQPPPYHFAPRAIVWFTVCRVCQNTGLASQGDCQGVRQQDLDGRGRQGPQLGGRDGG